MTRKEHLQWSKNRALELCDSGKVSEAFASMASDLSKHPETVEHMGIEMGYTMLLGGHIAGVLEMRTFIEGFN